MNTCLILMLHLPHGVPHAALVLRAPEDLPQEVPPEDNLGDELLHLETRGDKRHDEKGRPRHPLQLGPRRDRDVDHAAREIDHPRHQRNDSNNDTAQQQEQRRDSSNGPADGVHPRREGFLGAQAVHGSRNEDDHQKACEDGGNREDGNDGDEEQVDGPGGDVIAGLLDELLNRVGSIVNGLFDVVAGVYGEVEHAEGLVEDVAGLETPDGAVVLGGVEGAGAARGEELVACH